MDKRFTDLTREGRIRLRDFLLMHAERGEEVVAIKEVPPERHVRVACEEGSSTVTFAVRVIVVGGKEVVACNSRDGDLAFNPDYPCIVRV